MKIFGAIMLAIFIVALDFGITSLLVYGICWCFGANFTFKVALGVWLITIIVGAVIRDNQIKKEY